MSYSLNGSKFNKSCSSQTPLSEIMIKFTFKNKRFDFKVNKFCNWALIIFTFFCHFIEDNLTFPIGGLYEILKNFLESVELYFLKIYFFINFCNSSEDSVKMLLFLLFCNLQFIFNLFEFFQNLREFLIFLIFKIRFERVELIKEHIGSFLVIHFVSKWNRWWKVTTLRTLIRSLTLRIH